MNPQNLVSVEPAVNRKSLSLAVLLLTFALPGAAQQRVVPTLHVATTGSDQNAGTEAAPFKTVQRGVDAAKPGDAIMVHAGTHKGVVVIKKSGVPGLPIVIRPAGDGEAILTADFPKTSCASTFPTRDRTIQILDGSDHWVIKDMTVVNGILVAGKNANTLDQHVADRNLPGRDRYDQAAAATLLPLLGVDPSDYIRLARNKVTRRGIQVTASRWSRVVYNEVSQIDCGTGAGILLTRFSDFGVVRGNFVHHNSPSVEHPMEEGVRVSSGTSYTLIEGNLAEDLVGRGRGFTTDVHASWNRYVRNTARRTEIGFNEQDGGWGNVWADNRAENVRGTGFSIDSKDRELVVPDDGVPAYLNFTGNCSLGNSQDLGMGAVQASTFENNSFTTLSLGKNLIEYWTDSGNMYDGSTEVPTTGGPAKSWCS